MFFSRENERPTGLIFNPEQDNDPRNLLWEDIMPLSGVDIPESGDVEFESWTLNQLKTTSCTCHSTVHLFNQMIQKKFSPRYAFWKIKTDPKYPSSQLPEGAYMADSLKLAINEGICGVPYHPNDYNGSDEDYLQSAPSDLAKYDASQHALGGKYFYVTTRGTNLEKFDQIVSYLNSSKKACKVGIVWRTSFNNARKTGIVPAVEPTGKSVGHDMLAVAWKTIGGHQYLGFRNSYGDNWGDNGRIWLPRGLFTIQSALGYLEPEKTQPDAPQKTTVAVRDYDLEKSKAKSLRTLVYQKFPLDVNKGAQHANNIAREIFGRAWLDLVPAVTYLDWSNTDVVNFLYARSRNKTDSIAYSIDFTLKKSLWKR